MTNGIASRQVPLHGAILASNWFIGTGSFICLRVAGSESILFGVCLGLFLVSLLPWLAFLRRKIWSRRFAAGRMWMNAVAALLWVSLLIGPAATGSMWIGTRLSYTPDGMSRFSSFVGIAVVAVISFSAAFWLSILALLIQLWRDQWRARLTATTIGFLFLLFVAYCWAIGTNKQTAETVAPNRKSTPTLISTSSVRGSDDRSHQRSGEWHENATAHEMLENPRMPGRSLSILADRHGGRSLPRLTETALT